MEYKLLENTEVDKIRSLTKGGCGFETIEVMRDSYKEIWNDLMERGSYGAADDYNKIAVILENALKELERFAIKKIL